MLKKLVAALNPFHAKRVSTPVVVKSAPHPHTFSCPCPTCEAETQRLTLVRLKEQSPGKS